MLATRLTGVLGLLCFAFAVAAQQPPPANTTDRAHPFVVHIESIYGQHVAAAARGDVEATKKLRSKEAFEFMFEALKKMKKTTADFGMLLKSSAESAVDLKTLQFIRAEKGKSSARLIYQDVVRKEDGQFVRRGSVLVVRWEEASWRVHTVITPVSVSDKPPSENEWKSKLDEAAAHSRAKLD